MIIKARSLAEEDFAIDLPSHVLSEALLIRHVEEKFLDLFSTGEMNGTVHTSIGQEFSAVLIAGQLLASDWVTSNHRCHGHFISKTKKWKALISELMGFKSGICNGIGSSQHLFDQGFLSNGIQGSLLPVGSGIAKVLQEKGDGIVASFFGEGTLGEGVVYETLNLASLYSLPQLFVCENNFYSQSTPQEKAISGSIIERAECFGIKTFEVNTWNLKEFQRVSQEAISYVRNGAPAFILVTTYRLNAHSKGDDNRDQSEVDFFKENDPIFKLLKQDIWKARSSEIILEINNYLSSVPRDVLDKSEYFTNDLPIQSEVLTLLPVFNKNERLINALNRGYENVIKNGSYFIGEDICDPYGGAFKVTKGFSTAYPDKVIGTPISESAIVGMAIGMALIGKTSFVEIMFGDFITLAFDQLINNASKMKHMYAGKVDVPIRIRCPMGGKRGYGPTHSQSLEKFLLGIDNIQVISISSFVDPGLVIENTVGQKNPIIIIESKSDYGNLLWRDNELYSLFQDSNKFGNLILSPCGQDPSLTIVSYGETARHIADNIDHFFTEVDEIPEQVILTQLHPLNIDLIKKSLLKTKSLLIVEDGSVEFGINSEIVTRLVECNIEFKLVRVGAEPVPIPSIASLENLALPTINRIIEKFISGKIKWEKY